MSKEATARILRPEFGRNQSVIAEVTHVDFSAGPGRGVIERNKIVGISGSVVTPLEIISTKQEIPSNIIEFPKIIKPEIAPVEEVKKEASYNPGKRSKSYIDELGRRIIRKRGRSGCRCHGEERSLGCRSRSCRNKDKEVKVIDIRAKSSETRRGSRQVAARRPLHSPAVAKAA